MRTSEPVDTNKYRTGLYCKVLRSADGSDCTLGGVTSTHTEVLLVGPGVNGPFSVEGAESREVPVLYLHRWHMDGFGEDTMFASPDPDPRMGGYMFGGNFIFTSDSRFPCKHGAIKVHDRQEHQHRTVKGQWESILARR